VRFDLVGCHGQSKGLADLANGRDRSAWILERLAEQAIGELMITLDPAVERSSVAHGEGGNSLSSYSESPVLDCRCCDPVDCSLMQTLPLAWLLE